MGGGVAYKMLIKQITYIRGDVCRENEEFDQNNTEIAQHAHSCKKNGKM